MTWGMKETACEIICGAPATLVVKRERWDGMMSVEVKSLMQNIQWTNRPHKRQTDKQTNTQTRKWATYYNNDNQKHTHTHKKETEILLAACLLRERALYAGLYMCNQVMNPLTETVFFSACWDSVACTSCIIVVNTRQCSLYVLFFIVCFISLCATKISFFFLS